MYRDSTSRRETAATPRSTGSPKHRPPHADKPVRFDAVNLRPPRAAARLSHRRRRRRRHRPTRPPGPARPRRSALATPTPPRPAYAGRVVTSARGAARLHRAAIMGRSEGGWDACAERQLFLRGCSAPWRRRGWGWEVTWRRGVTEGGMEGE